jgi:hypothetical protein
MSIIHSFVLCYGRVNCIVLCVRYGKLFESHLKHARFDVFMMYDNDLLGCDTCVLVDGCSVTEKCALCRYWREQFSLEHWYQSAKLDGIMILCV